MLDAWTQDRTTGRLSHSHPQVAEAFAARAVVLVEGASYWPASATRGRNGTSGAGSSAPALALTSLARTWSDSASTCARRTSRTSSSARSAPAAVEDVLAANGDLAPFCTLQKQRQWQGRPAEEQLRRFMGSSGSGKLKYARLLVDALDLDRVPTPLDGVLAHV